MEPKTRAPALTIEILPNEILLQIFQSGLLPSTLLTCMLTCKRWTDLASAVLYQHVVLTLQALTRWIASSPQSKDSTIESLTVRIFCPSPGPEREDPTSVMNQLRTGLDVLSSRIANMRALRSFSLHSPDGLCTGMWVPDSPLADILSQIPASCSSLELEFGQTHDWFSRYPKTCHLCLNIKRLFPQLRYLRLATPELCPEAFGKVDDSAPSSFAPIEAPFLEQCLVKVSKTTGARSMVCESPDSNIVTTLAECLRAFASPETSPKLEQLWILDARNSDYDSIWTTLRSIVRRDVLADRSLALPYQDVAGPQTPNSVFIRAPVEGQNEASTDIVTSWAGVKDLAEGHIWTETTIGARLPTRYLPRTSLIPVVPVTRTVAEFTRQTNKWCLLWAHEKDLKTKILWVEEGGLTEDCVPTMRVPEGWFINEGGMLEASS